MVKIFIADPALKTHQGHHYNVTLAFALSIKKQGFDVTILANQSLNMGSVILGVPIKSVFSTDTYSKHKVNIEKSRRPLKINMSSNSAPDITSKVENFILLNQKILRRIAPEWFLKKIKKLLKNHLFKEIPFENFSKDTLAAIFHKYKVTKDDFVFFHTADAETYKDVVNLFVKDVSVGSWGNLPRILLSSPYDEKIMPHNNQSNSANISVLHLKKLQLVNYKVFLFAENEILSEHMSDYFTCKVDALYVPFKKSCNTSKTHARDSIITFSYLGAARSEKGFVLVVEAVIKFLSKSSRRNVKFLIQASPQILGYTYDIKKAVDRLKLVNDERLEILYSSQSPEEYDKSLAATNCFFLCYNYANYQYRSSGIVIEALVSAKNAIVTKGTFPDKILGVAGISIENVDDIVLAIDKFINQKKLYEKKALNREQWFISRCEVNSFYSNISNINKYKNTINKEIKEIKEIKEVKAKYKYKKLL